MEAKTCLVTGANRGIGFESARVLARLGAKVLVAARDAARGEQAVEAIRCDTGNRDVHLIVLDLGSRASIEQAAATVCSTHERLDVLVNNAGAMLSDRRLTDDGFEATLGVNHLGHFLLTDLLRERLAATAKIANQPARIITVSSLIHHLCRGGPDFDDLFFERKRYNGWLAYAQSKLANILFSIELARRLDPIRVTANAVHPGVVRSGFGLDGDTRGVTGFLMRTSARLKNPIQRPPGRAAEAITYLATSPDVARVSGEYYAHCRLARRSRAARDLQLAERLWHVTASLWQKVAARGPNASGPIGA